MSSTNRSSHRRLHPKDYYRTPTGLIESFMKNFPGELSKEIQILDPSAGGDKYNLSMPYPTVLKNRGFKNITTLDIRPDSSAGIIEDFLFWKPDKKYDMIITNPPFDKVIKFVSKALWDCKEGGLVIMLLRLNFFGGTTRMGFWKKYMPKYTLVHAKRPSFTNDGKTDSTEYVHCIWRKGNYPEFTNLKVI